MNTVEKCLRQVLNERNLKIAEERFQFTEITNATAIAINSGQFKGYLLFFNSTNTFDPDLLAKIFKELSFQMDRCGEYLQPMSDPVVVEFDPSVLGELAQKYAEFGLSSQTSFHQLMFCYFPVSQFPIVHESAIPGYSNADPRETLFPDTKMAFDLYIYLTKNNRVILYKKKEDLLNQEAFNKLTHNDIKHIFFKKEEKDLFNVYQAQNQILASIANKKRKAG